MSEKQAVLPTLWSSEEEYTELYNMVATMRPHASRNTVIATLRANRRELQLLTLLQSLADEGISVGADGRVPRGVLTAELDQLLAWSRRGQKTGDTLADEAYNRALSVVEMYCEERMKLPGPPTDSPKEVR